MSLFINKLLMEEHDKIVSSKRYPKGILLLSHLIMTQGMHYFLPTYSLDTHKDR
jgi:hypothetical protein